MYYERNGIGHKNLCGIHKGLAIAISEMINIELPLLHG